MGTILVTYYNYCCCKRVCVFRENEYRYILPQLLSQQPRDVGSTVLLWHLSTGPLVRGYKARKRQNWDSEVLRF